MSESYDVEPLKATRPQVGGHSLFAGIDAVSLGMPGKAGEGSATVDKQSVATRRHDENGVTLPHVENRGLQLASLKLRREWISGDDYSAGNPHEDQSAPKVAYCRSMYPKR